MGTIGCFWVHFGTFGYFWALLCTLSSLVTFRYFWVLLVTFGYYWVVLAIVGTFEYCGSPLCIFVASLRFPWASKTEVNLDKLG